MDKKNRTETHNTMNIHQAMNHFDAVLGSRREKFRLYDISGNAVYFMSHYGSGRAIMKVDIECYRNILYGSRCWMPMVRHDSVYANPEIMGDAKSRERINNASRLAFPEPVQIVFSPRIWARIKDMALRVFISGTRWLSENDFALLKDLQEKDSRFLRDDYLMGALKMYQFIDWAERNPGAMSGREEMPDKKYLEKLNSW